MNHSPYVRRRFFAPPAALAALALLGGCGGPPDNTLSGNVQVDGAALTGGTILFLPVGSPESAKLSTQIDENGNFSLPNVPADQVMVAVVPVPDAAEETPNTKKGGYTNMPTPPAGAPVPAGGGGGRPSGPKGKHMDVNEKFSKFSTSGIIWDVKKEGSKKVIQVTK
jgi:hypothetical protein